MTDASKELVGQVHDLMRTQADLLDELDRERRERRRERDGLLLGMLDVLDSVYRGLEAVDDPTGREVLEAAERQIELAFAKSGITTYTIEVGVQPSFEEIEVVETLSNPDLGDLAVVRTIHPGLRDNERILRKAAVAINKTGTQEEA